MQDTNQPTQTPAIETVQKVQRRVVLMPRGQKNSVIRETRITLPRLRCLEDKA